MILPDLLSSRIDAQLIDKMVLILILFVLFDVIQYLGSHRINLKCKRIELLLGQFMLGQILLGDDIALSNILKYRLPWLGICLGFDFEST